MVNRKLLRPEDLLHVAGDRVRRKRAGERRIDGNPDIARNTLALKGERIQLGGSDITRHSFKRDVAPRVVQFEIA